MKSFVYFIGIDVSKRYLDTCILESLSIPVKQKRFDNTVLGNKELLEWVQIECHNTTDCLFCLEHTGVYAYPICIELSERKYFFSLVSPVEVQRTVGFKRGKSDKADSKSIAQFAFLRSDVIRLCTLPAKKLGRLHHLLSFRLRLIKARHGFQISASESSAFVEKELYKEVNVQSKQLVTMLTRRIKKIETLSLEIIHSDEQLDRIYDLLLSIPGIGALIATQLIVTTNCFTLFENNRKFACYCGVVPFPFESGTSIKRKARVSNFANKKLKSLLTMAVLVARRRDGQFKLYYKRKTDEGKNPMLVINNLKNKLIARIFATIHRGTPFVQTMNFAT